MESQQYHQFDNIIVQNCEVQRIECSPNGLQIAYAISGSIYFYDTVLEKSRPETLCPEQGDILALKYCPDCLILASGGGIYYDYEDDQNFPNNAIHLWDCVNYKLLRVLEGHAMQTFSLDSSGDGSNIISSSDDGFKIWATETGNQIGDPIFTQYFNYFVQYSTDYEYFLSIDVTGVIHVWNAQNRELIKQIYCYLDRRSAPSSLQMTYSQIIFSIRSGLIYFFNSFTGVLARKLFIKQDSYSATFMSEFKLIASTDSEQLKIYDQRTLKQLRVLLSRKWEQIKTLQFSPDGRFIVCRSIAGLSIISVCQ